MSWRVRAPVTGSPPFCDLRHSGVLTLLGVLQANILGGECPLGTFPVGRRPSPTAPSAACTHPTSTVHNPCRGEHFHVEWHLCAAVCDEDTSIPQGQQESSSYPENNENAPALRVWLSLRTPVPPFLAWGQFWSTFACALLSSGLPLLMGRPDGLDPSCAAWGTMRALSQLGLRCVWKSGALPSV